MPARSIWSGVLVAATCCVVAASCSSDDAKAPGPGASGTLGDGGPDTSSGATGGRAGSGGTSGGRGGSGGATGGSAGTGGVTGGSGGTAGAAGGTAGDAGGGTAGSTGGGPIDGGGRDAGGTAGADTGPDVAPPCPNCDGGPCVDGGVCVECTRDQHCSGATPYCDLARNECVECSPANDTCSAGNYCNALGSCVKGCKNAASCASGICTPSHDCANCVNNGECSGQKLCGSGVCSEACSASGPPGQCGSGFTCCEPRCVDTDRDIGHCGACGAICNNQQFCGTTGCVSATFANICNLTIATALLDGAPADAVAAQTVLTGLGTHCAPAPTTRSVDQLASDAINPTTGRVVMSGGEMLVLVGGPYLNRAVRYMEDQRQVPVYNSGTFPTVGFYRSADGTPIVTDQFVGTGWRDLFVIQVGRELGTGTLTLVTYGFHEFGTRAATWYLANVMLPNLSTRTQTYYVYRWVDAGGEFGGNKLPELGDTWELLGSG